MYYLNGRGSLSRLTTVSFDNGTYTGTLGIARTSVLLTSTSKDASKVTLSGDVTLSYANTAACQYLTFAGGLTIQDSVRCSVEHCKVTGPSKIAVALSRNVSAYINDVTGTRTGTAGDVFNIANTANVSIKDCSATGYSKTSGAAFTIGHCNYVAFTGTNTASTSAYAIYMVNSVIEFSSSGTINYNNIGTV